MLVLGKNEKSAMCHSIIQPDLKKNKKKNTDSLFNGFHLAAAAAAAVLLPVIYLLFFQTEYTVILPR